MPVLTEDSNKEEIQRSSWNFIRIQNLPWTACRTDIRKFFNGLSIKKGGILVRNFEAFVAFECPNDVRLALYRRNILLHGFKLELSIINEVQLRKILGCIVRRTLDFENIIKRDISKLHFEAPPRRKIRPTPVLKGDKQRSLACSVFLPEETDFFSRTVDGSTFAGISRCGKRSFSGTRKVHPTSVSDATEMENLAVFHPEECYEAKKIKLQV